MANLFNTPPPEIPVNHSVQCAGRNYWIEEATKVNKELSDRIKEDSNSSTLEASKASTHENE